MNFGILPAQEIEALIGCGAIVANRDFVEGQVQPASLDLRLGSRAFRVRASFLPGPKRTVAQRLFELKFDEIDLYNKGKGAVLEKNCVYVAEIDEWLRLPEAIGATTKSQKFNRSARRLYAHHRGRYRPFRHDQTWL